MADYSTLGNLGLISAGIRHLTTLSVTSGSSDETANQAIELSEPSDQALGNTSKPLTMEFV